MSVQMTKPVYTVAYQNNFDPIAAHVAWLKEKREGIKKIAAIALLALEIFVLAYTLIGIPLLFKIINLSKVIDARRRFDQAIISKKKPDIQEKIITKTTKRTFNHINEYAIEDGIIYYRKRGVIEAWRPIFFDGREGDIPEEIDCDGANLIVWDNRRRVHYKKVLIEYRKEELDLKKNPHFKGKSIDFDNYEYFAVDKSANYNWKDKWFSLPLVNYLVNIFAGKKLTIPENVKSIAISQKGRYCNYFTDGSAQRHFVSTETTLYALYNNGRDIHQYDPWSPIHADTEISLPETEKKIFEAEKIRASASTVMAIGYETNLNTRRKKLKIVSRHADIATEGGDPFLTYDFFPNPKDSSVIVLPIETKWKEHPLYLSEKACITDRITILQTGEGNDARELRVDGQNDKGEWGYYWKNITDHDWKFIKQEIKGNLITLAPKKNAKSDEILQTTVHNYTGTLKTAELVQSVKMKNFGYRSTHSKIKFLNNEQKYHIHVYKRGTFWNFLGLKNKQYDLVIPEKYHQDQTIKKIFGNKKVIPLNVSVNEKKVKLTSKGLNFSFSKQKN